MQGVFLPLPENVGTVPGGVIIQDGLTVVITDVRLYNGSTTTVGEVDLISMGQVPGPDEPVRLFGHSMITGWQSSLGVIFTSDEATARGIALRKTSSAGLDIVADVEIAGYVR
jgi:hypothetical protein